MAKIVMDGQEKEVADGSSITQACEELGVTFSCYEGSCGTCEITVLRGAENLSAKTEEEELFGIEEGKRLACQCKIISGEVEISYD